MLLWLKAFLQIARLCTEIVYCTISKTHIKYNSKRCPHVAEGPSVSVSVSLSCCLSKTIFLFPSAKQK